MNFRQTSDVKIGLLLHGLRAIYVEENEKERQELIEQCETALASRGKKLAYG